MCEGLNHYFAVEINFSFGKKYLYKLNLSRIKVYRLPVTRDVNGMVEYLLYESDLPTKPGIMNIGHFFLLLTVLSETAAVIFMKLSSGFQNKLTLLIAVICYALSFVFLTLSLKYLPAGIANAIWAGASALLVAVLGLFIFNERLSTIQFLSLVLIVVGLIGLNISVK